MKRARPHTRPKPITTAARWDDDPAHPRDRLAVHFDMPTSPDLVADPIDISHETMTSRDHPTAQVAEVHDRLVLSDDAARWLAETLLVILLRRGHTGAHEALQRLMQVQESMLPDLNLDAALGALEHVDARQTEGTDLRQWEKDGFIGRSSR